MENVGSAYDKEIEDAEKTYNLLKSIVLFRDHDFREFFLQQT